MKKLPLLLIFIGIVNSCNTLNAQVNIDCFESFQFKTSTTPSANAKTLDIIFSWDISAVQNKKNMSLQLEVQPINSCWKLLEGSNRSEAKNYKLSIDQKSSGTVDLKFIDLNCKCLKWRVKMNDISNDCIQYTPWEFESLLN